MSFIRRFFRTDPQYEFEKATLAFENKKYKSAFKSFEKAYRHFDTQEMKLLSLDNAALSAENAEMYTKASEFYFQSMLNLISNNHPYKVILQAIDRCLRMNKLNDKPIYSSNQFLYFKFLIFLSLKQFDKLSLLYDKNRRDFTDSYGNAIHSAWKLIQDADTFIQKEPLPKISLPSEFQVILTNAEEIMQRCSLCYIEISLTDKDLIIEKGTEFSLSATLTAHAPISIHNILLKTGAKGRIISNSLPELPLNLSTGENYTINYDLVPNLPGKWKIGPLILDYRIPNEEGEYPGNSNRINISAKDAEPTMKIQMTSETIEEDLKYLITILVENVGKIALQNVKIGLELPDGVEVFQGTKEKIISSLAEGETFEFEVSINFDLERTHFEGHVIKTLGFINEDQRLAKSSVKLGGRESDL
ncbi:MAG: hypothetical protein ACXAB2_11130 [Candidatus Hodarchaeales archaeon]|jgi:tetratricopeptide (TPR) repeat protein